MARGKGMSPTRRRKRHTRPEVPAFTVADYYRQRLVACNGPASPPTFADYRRAAGLD